MNKNLKISFEKSNYRMIPVRKVSNKYLKNIINFKLNFTMSRGLAKTIEWYKKNKNDSK